MMPDVASASRDTERSSAVKAERLFSRPTERELVTRARAMIPILLERARGCEEARRVPEETIAEFRAAGFFEILKLPRFGGYGMSIVTLSRVIQEVGRGCMPSAWVLFVLGSHQYELALMSDQAAEDIYGDNRDALVGSSYAPLGSMTKAPGGYQLKGTWRFCSGIDHAQWVGVGGMVKVPGRDRPEFRSCLVPRRDFVIDQNSWHTIGLAGTGSKDFTIDNAFVPEHLSHNLIDAHLMLGQDELPSWHRYPYWQVVNLAMCSAIIGGALGAIDEFKRQFAARTSSFDSGSGRGSAADDPFVKWRLGQATILVRGAIDRVETIGAEMDRRVAEGETMPIEDRLSWAAEGSQVGKMCEEAGLLLFKATGARGLAVDNRIQSILRNILGGSNHVAMNVDSLNTALGNMMLGRDNTHFAC